MNPASTIILGSFPIPVRELANDVRAYLYDRLPGIEEQPDFPAKMIAFGYGPGYNDMICTLLLSLKGVKIGFYKGASLPDPAGLLTGTGKVHRYVEIHSAKDLNGQLDQLIRVALGAYKERKATEK
jgi:hypothetical protein